MKKLFTLCMALGMALGMMATEWSTVDWLGDGAGNGAYTEKYKCAGQNVNVVNIQQPGFATAPGIYMHVGAAISTLSLDASAYAIQGAGVIVYLSAFVNQVTTFTITDANNTTYDVEVYYVDGATALDDFEISPKVQKIIENGQIILIRNGVRYNALGAKL